jgi:uncharacterized repeat protein (TIGR01451 family)
MRLEDAMPSNHSTRTLLLALVCLSLAATANAQLTFTKAFVPNTIGPGSVSTLTFSITNIGASNESDLAFTDTLPAGVTIASPAAATNTCLGTLSAPDGGGTVTFSGGEIAPAPAVCIITVNVTSSTPGLHTNTSGDLTSTAGTTSGASGNLTVDTNRPGFTKSFAPNPIPLGYRSTLTFTIDNTANPSSTSFSFTDPLPAGIEVADPANATTSCIVGAVSAIPGTSVVSYLGGFVAGASSCTVSVDVIGNGVGQLGNTTSELVISGGTSGRAAAVLEVTVDPLSLVKSFTDDPIPPGGTGTLEFTITNYDRFDSATSISFTDDLNATLAGLAATGLPLNDVCGSGSQLSGAGVITMTGGNLAPGTSCTFSTTIQVPAAAAAGNYVNTTSSISGDIGGTPVTGSPGQETLYVYPAPVLTKTFVGDPGPPATYHPVGAGSTTTIRFSITNTSPTSPATDIAFIDEIVPPLPFPASVTLPAAGFCGAGATMALISTGIDRQGLSMTSGSLAVSGSCTFDVQVNIPVGFPGGDYLNTTEEITATVDATTVTGNPASATLQVIGAPFLTKEFTDDPVLPGATATMQLTLTHDPFAAADATAIAFTDDLNAVVAGLAATGLPLNDICGTGSQISGTTNLSFTGGTLTPGATCTFPVTLQVPAAAPAGNHSNTTSYVTATSSGVTTIGYGASDNLLITGLTFSKSFTDDPVIPGGTVTLEFTLDNTLAPDAATGLFFTDDLNAALAGLTPTGLPLNDICGAGSLLQAAGSLLIFSGGNLPGGGSCSFSVSLGVPAAAADGVYGNTTSSLSATVGTPPAAAILPPAVDGLTVLSDLLSLAKTFTDDPVPPSGTVTMELTLLNLDGSQTATAIGFTDDLDAALTGLTAVGLPAAGFCGPGSTITGAGLLTVAGAELGPGASCTFSVTLQVPAAAPSLVTNTTSSVSGLIDGLPVTGPPASDDLMINNLSFSKSFSSAGSPGQPVTLSFEIQNVSTATVTDISFLDDLDAVVAGLAATGLPSSGDCGGASTVSGTSTVQLDAGSLAPGGSCTINVTVQVPAGAAPGTYPNTTSDLYVGGTPTVAPATADLVIEPPPVFSKSFAPTTVILGISSTMTLTIDNSASTVDATGLDVTDSLPAGMEVANPANASTTCTGGTVTAVAGTTTVAYSGGTVAAGASCTITADVVGTAIGALVNTTGNLTSSAGDSGTASDTLQVTAAPLPVLTMSFNPAVVEPGMPSTMMMTIDNSASLVDATGLQVSLNLPANVVIADPANASASCTGGVLTAVAGTSLFDYSGGSVAAGAVCTLQADVVGATEGTYDITSGDLTSSIGNSGPASATLQVSLQQLIPTLDLWGLMILGCLIGLVALWRIRAMAAG